MSNIDPSDWLLSNGVPAAKFPTIGTTIKGTVIGSEVQQQRDFDSKEPKFYDDGNPMMQMVVTLATDERDPEVDGDDGTRKLYVKGQMIDAVRTAVRAAGTKLDVGGTLAVQYVSDGTPSRKGLNPPKQYRAQFKPGNKAVDDLLDSPAETTPAAPQPAAADLLDA